MFEVQAKIHADAVFAVNYYNYRKISRDFLAAFKFSGSLALITHDAVIYYRNSPENKSLANCDAELINYRNVNKSLASVLMS